MKKPIRLASLCMVATLALAGCSGSNAPSDKNSPPAQTSGSNLSPGNPAAAPEANKVQVILSSELMPTNSKWWTDPPDESQIKYKLDQQQDLALTKVSEDKLPGIKVSADKQYQTILGMGSSLEDTSVYAILKNKTDDQAKEVLRSLIDPKEGLGMNLFRVTIGTSDFSDGRAVSSNPYGFYTYQDDPNKPFSIENDKTEGIIKVLKMAIEVGKETNNEIKFFASCWSPPGWMKTSGKIIGGSLNPGSEQQYADYLTKFVQAYEQEGIPIYAITTGNEPMYSPPQYPGMLMSWEQQRDVTIALHDSFAKNGIDTKIWIFDHNFDGWLTPLQILNSLKDMGKLDIVDAVAFHHYGGSPTDMSSLHNQVPDKNIVFSEGSVWGASGMARIANYFNNWSQSYVAWVTMSTQTTDEHDQGPYNKINNFTPTYLIKNDGDNPNWYKTADYYLLGQYTKYVKPGAIRIDSLPDTGSGLTSVAFQNPDGKIVLVVSNVTDPSKSFKILYGDCQIAATVPAKSVATFIWDSKTKTSTLEGVAAPVYQ